MENNSRKMVSIIVPIYSAELYLKTTLEYEQYKCDVMSVVSFVNVIEG